MHVHPRQKDNVGTWELSGGSYWNILPRKRPFRASVLLLDQGHISAEVSHLDHLSQSEILLSVWVGWGRATGIPRLKLLAQKTQTGEPRAQALTPDSPRESRPEILPVTGTREPQGKPPLGTWGPPTAATASAPRRACANCRFGVLCSCASTSACALGVRPRGRGPLSPTCAGPDGNAASRVERAASAALAPPPAAPPARPAARRLIPRARSGEPGAAMGSGMSQVTSGPGRTVFLQLPQR